MIQLSEKLTVQISLKFQIHRIQKFQDFNCSMRITSVENQMAIKKLREYRQSAVFVPSYPYLKVIAVPTDHKRVRKIATLLFCNAEKVYIVLECIGFLLSQSKRLFYFAQII